MLNFVENSLLALMIGAFVAGSVGAEYPLGDLNEDCEVNSDDLQIVVGQWLDTGGCSEPNCADLNGDNIVNMFDFALFATN